MGEKWLKNKQRPRISWKKTESNKFLESVFFKPFLPHVWDSVFFQTTKNNKFSQYPFQTFFSTRVLETYLGGLKLACIGPALSKFRPSCGNGAT